MTTNFDVLSYGTIGMDIILRVPHWPTSDLSTHSETSDETLGGKATNTAAHLAHWGLSVAVSGTSIGDDEMGRRLLAAVGRIDGIDTRYLGRIPGLRSMYCIILVRPDGERAIIGVHTDTITPTPPTPEMIAGARLLTLDLYGGDERVRAARMAVEAGRPVVVGDIRRFDHPVLPFTTVAIASLAELRQEYGEIAPVDCASRLLESGAKTAVITSGAGMVFVSDREEGAAGFLPPRVEPVDTTGAGDAFKAGMIYGVLAGYPMLRAAMVGAAAGAHTVGQLGAATSPAALPDLLAAAGALRPEPG